MFQNVKQSSQLYRQNHVSLNDTQRSFFSNSFFPSFPEKDLTNRMVAQRALSVNRRVIVKGMEVRDVAGRKALLSFSYLGSMVFSI
jgi:hypothetical protein